MTPPAKVEHIELDGFDAALEAWRAQAREGVPAFTRQDDFLTRFPLEHLLELAHRGRMAFASNARISRVITKVPEPVKTVGEHMDEAQARMQKSFATWLFELEGIATKAGAPEYIQSTGPGAWMEAYEIGASPAEAWADETAYAADDAG